MAKKQRHEEASEQMEQLDESSIVEDTVYPEHAPNEHPPEPLALTSPNDPEALRAMFATVAQHDEVIAGIEAKLEIAKSERSGAIEAICTALGNKGPWNIGGRMVSVAIRDGKYSFRRQAEAKLTL